MDASGLRRVYFVGGEAVELWENPNVKFGTSQEDLELAARNEDWVALFNMLVLSSVPD